jgi:acetyltransferase
MLGVARLHDNADNISAEFAILVRSDLKTHGLGWQLMQMIFSGFHYTRIAAISG